VSQSPPHQVACSPNKLVLSKMSEKTETSNQMGVGRLTSNLPFKRAKPSRHLELGSRSSSLCSKRPKLPKFQTSPNGKNGRNVEVGFVTGVTPVPFYLIFERAPVWLLVLEPSICSGVYFTEIENAHGLLKLLNEQGCDPALFNRAVT
jgi:hypothetical protein